MDISVVIPCFNESEAVSPLARRLDELLKQLESDYETEFVFVDDGSTDNTFERLKTLYQDRKSVSIVRHTSNQGLGAAIRTGLSHAKGHFQVVIDSDCTYDPLIIPDMLRQMEPDVDILTASPYAPGGRVLNVDRFQIFISQWCSKLYRIILRSDIHTFTCMFRIYRKSVWDTVSFQSNTFLSMAEIITQAIQRKLNVQEFPTTLSARQHGYSKRKILRLTLEHLRLMALLIQKK